MLEIFTEEELEEMRQKYEERERKEQFELSTYDIMMKNNYNFFD